VQQGAAFLLSSGCPAQLETETQCSKTLLPRVCLPSSITQGMLCACGPSRLRCLRTWGVCCPPSTTRAAQTSTVYRCVGMACSAQGVRGLMQAAARRPHALRAARSFAGSSAAATWMFVTEATRPRRRSLWRCAPRPALQLCQLMHRSQRRAVAPVCHAQLEDTDVNPIGCISGKCVVLRARSYEEVRTGQPANWRATGWARLQTLSLAATHATCTSINGMSQWGLRAGRCVGCISAHVATCEQYKAV
jgi:hypothetical protein